MKFPTQSQLDRFRPNYEFYLRHGKDHTREEALHVICPEDGAIRTTYKTNHLTQYDENGELAITCFWCFETYGQVPACSEIEQYAKAWTGKSKAETTIENWALDLAGVAAGTNRILECGPLLMPEELFTWVENNLIPRFSAIAAIQQARKMSQEARGYITGWLQDADLFMKYPVEEASRMILRRSLDESAQYFHKKYGIPMEDLVRAEQEVLAKHGLD